jgi:hypothetical protein
MDSGYSNSVGVKYLVLAPMNPTLPIVTILCQLGFFLPVVGVNCSEHCSTGSH